MSGLVAEYSDSSSTEEDYVTSDSSVCISTRSITMSPSDSASGSAGVVSLLSRLRSGAEGGVLHAHTHINT